MVKKRKFKNNKKPISPERELQRLANEQKTLQKLAENIKMGDCDHIHPAIFSKLRALICTGSWTMKPLLQRVLKFQEFNPKFFSSAPSENSDILHKAILSKQWISKSGNRLSHEVDLDEYLQQAAYYNHHEDRYITRNELIRLFADTEGSHFDPEEDLYSASLHEENITFGELSLSFKELFMWDIYMLVDWHINLLMLELHYRAEFKRHGLMPQLIFAMKNEISRMNDHYDPILKGALLSFSMKGVRLCVKCKTGELEKFDEFTFKCQACGHDHEL